MGSPDLEPCGSCQRHARRGERLCPFCGERLVFTPSRPFALNPKQMYRGAIFAAIAAARACRSVHAGTLCAVTLTALGVGGAACSTKPESTTSALGPDGLPVGCSSPVPVKVGGSCPDGVYVPLEDCSYFVVCEAGVWTLTTVNPVADYGYAADTFDDAGDAHQSPADAAGAASDASEDGG